MGRLHQALVTHNYESSVTVDARRSDDWRISGPSNISQKLLSRLLPHIDQLPLKLQTTNNIALHSTGWAGRVSARKMNSSDADVVNLHWICHGLISVEAIGRIEKPLVWTLHDMWPFCGAEHYASDNDKSRWRSGYVKSNRDPSHRGLDVDRWVWRRKLKAWRRRIEIIAPTRWMAHCAQTSALMQDWSVTTIPNVIDVDTYRPLPKQVARDVLRLPSDAKLILFGAIGGIADPRKGWDLLQPALKLIAGTIPGVHAVVFGQNKPRYAPEIGLPIHWLGYLNDDVTLALLYSAVDVAVVPSRLDNLPQIGVEAQCCGCPVVAFNTTGLPDVVDHGRTGYLAEPYYSDDLARGIEWALSDENHARLSAQARNRAIQLWSPNVVVPQYFDVYRRAIAGTV